MDGGMKGWQGRRDVEMDVMMEECRDRGREGWQECDAGMEGCRDRRRDAGIWGCRTGGRKGRIQVCRERYREVGMD